MRSSTVFASALAFAASVFAQTDGYAVMTSPTKGESVPSGQTFTIVWEAGKYTGDATISLLGGDSSTTLVPGATLGTVDVAAGSFDWKVDCSLGKEKTYGIKITSAASPETFQYSFPFAISGPSCSSGAGSYPTLSSSVISSSSTSSSTSTKSSSTSSASSSTTTSAVETTSTSTSSTTVISSYVAITSSAGNNLSTTAVPTYSGTTILTTTSAAVVTPTGSSTTTSSVPVATGAANSAAAGSLALVGALAFAVMAM